MRNNNITAFIVGSVFALGLGISGMTRPEKVKELTLSLIFGAFIFGVGWALAGYCPGPAITSLASFQVRPLMFVVSMILGMILFRIYQAVLSKRRAYWNSSAISLH